MPPPAVAGQTAERSTNGGSYVPLGDSGEDWYCIWPKRCCWCCCNGEFEGEWLAGALVRESHSGRIRSAAVATTSGSGTRLNKINSNSAN